MNKTQQLAMYTRRLLLSLLLIIPFVSSAQVSRSTIDGMANVIMGETTAGANTKTRIGNAFKALNNSNFNKIDDPVMVSPGGVYLPDPGADRVLRWDEATNRAIWGLDGGGGGGLTDGIYKDITVRSAGTELWNNTIWKGSVRLKTASALPANTYSVISGIADILANSNGALTVDGVSVSTGDYIIVSEESNNTHDGIYEVLHPGTAFSKFHLQLRGDSRTNAQILGSIYYVTDGSLFFNTYWKQTGTLSGLGYSQLTFGTPNALIMGVPNYNTSTTLNTRALSSTDDAAYWGVVRNVGLNINKSYLAYSGDDVGTNQLTFSVGVDAGTPRAYFSDARSSPLGIEYFADYSSSLGSLSLVHKAYADARIAGKNLSSLVTSPGSGQNGYAITWDNTNNRYTLVNLTTGTVTAVNGTTNRITSTGGATPTIDISSTFEALLGKVANPLSQFASTTSSQLAGVMSNETGTGLLVFNDSPALAGTPTSPTASPGTNTTQVATTAFVTAAVAGAVTDADKGDITVTGSGSTWTIDAGAVTGSKIASSVALAGNPTTTTQIAGDNSTKIATTAYVDQYTTLTNGQIPVGNASNQSVGRTPSGDITMTNTGVFSLAIDRLRATGATTITGLMSWTGTLTATANNQSFFNPGGQFNLRTTVSDNGYYWDLFPTMKSGQTSQTSAVLRLRQTLDESLGTLTAYLLLANGTAGNTYIDKTGSIGTTRPINLTTQLNFLSASGDISTTGSNGAFTITGGTSTASAQAYRNQSTHTFAPVGSVTSNSLWLFQQGINQTSGANGPTGNIVIQTVGTSVVGAHKQLLITTSATVNPTNAFAALSIESLIGTGTFYGFNVVPTNSLNGLGTSTPLDMLHVASGNIRLGGSATAGLLKFMEPTGSGSNYTTISAVAQAGDIDLKWPAALPTVNNAAMVTNTTGSLSFIPVVRKLVGFSTSFTNVGTSEEDIYSYTVPANTIAITDDEIEFTGVGKFTDASADYTIKLYFAGNVVLNTSTISPSGGAAEYTWRLLVKRTGTTTAVAYGIVTTTSNPSIVLRQGSSSLTSLDFTTTNIAKATGQVGGGTGGAGDLTASTSKIVFYPGN